MMNARCAYQPLDIIHSEKAFAKVLKRNQKDDFCEWCMQRQMNLKACVKCRAVKYCSIDCQKSDWNDHKLECPYMKNLPSGWNEDYLRLLGRIILKVKGKQWKNVKIPFLNTVATFNDLRPCRDTDIKRVPFEMLHYKQLKKQMGKFIGEENVPEKDDMMEIMRKVGKNMILQNFDVGSIGFFLFLGSSCLEQGCIPSADFMVHKNVLKVMAIREINKESRKVTVNFNRLFSSEFENYTDINLNSCRCVSCTLPYGKTLLTKILNEDEAHSVILETQFILKEYDDICVKNASLISDGKLIDELLRKQIGILGDTNALHLRLLALKCFKHDCHPRIMWTNLKELEKLMSKVFGEFYLEILPIYEKLIPASVLVGEIDEVHKYLIKIKRILDALTL